MFKYLKRRQKYLETVRELSMMSDRDLYDIGISRYDIRRIAKEGAGRI